MKEREVIASKTLASARSLFEETLARESSRQKWERLFVKYPYALTTLLPLAVYPEHIVPSECSGELPVDMVFYSRDDGVARYGAVELDSPGVLAEAPARTRIAGLAGDSGNAILELQSRIVPGKELHHSKRNVVCVGNRSILFFVFGIEDDLYPMLVAEWGREGALPRTLQLVPFEFLRRLFTLNVKPQILLLGPDRRQGTNSAEFRLTPEPEIDDLSSTRCG